LLRITKLLHLRALRLEGRLQRVRLGGVAGLPGGAEVFPRLPGLVEEGPVVAAEVGLDGLPLLLLEVGEVELLGEARAHLLATASTFVTPAVTVIGIRGGDGER